MFHPVMAFLAPGGGEMLVVLMALLLLFGPKDAPRILRRSLEILRQIQQSANRFKNDLLSVRPDSDTPDCPSDTSDDDRGQVPPPAPIPPTPPGMAPP